MIAVESLVTVHEVNGSDWFSKDAKIRVCSHWNQNTLVVIEVDGKRITVAARDLEAAITNACNSARF